MTTATRPVLGPQRLGALPIVLGAVTVLAQVAYPLTSGSLRHGLTVATVAVFAAASLTHALVTRGARFAAVVVVAAVGGGFVIEVIGSSTGVPFGTYAYTGQLGWEVGGVPLVIPLAWAMMAYPCAVVARRITARRVPAVLIAAAGMVAWDLFLDPQMVAEGHWTWAADGAYLGIPLTNYVGWAVVAVAMQAAIVGAMPDRRAATPGGPWWRGADDRDDLVPIALWLWTYGGSIVAHVVFLGMPVSGLVGAVGMGPIAVALVLALRRPAPGA